MAMRAKDGVVGVDIRGGIFMAAYRPRLAGGGVAARPAHRGSLPEPTGEATPCDQRGCPMWPGEDATSGLEVDELQGWLPQAPSL